jgi:hypothetical protein
LHTLRGERPRPDGLLSFEDGSRRFDEQLSYQMGKLTVPALLRAMFAERPRRILQPSAWRALLDYRHLRARVRAVAQPVRRGYRAAYLRHVDPTVRSDLEALYDAEFSREDEAVYTAERERIDVLVSRITEPLGPTGEDTAAQGGADPVA